MAGQVRIAVVIGSLRKESFSRRFALALAGLAAPDISLEPVEIGALPLYNPDLDEAPPAPWTEFRSAIKAADAILFVTPEYNRSVPGPLKNALDVGSRPYGHSAWAGKPGAIVTVSPGTMGGFGANHHLRQSLVFLDVPTLPQPEAYIGGVDKLLTSENTFASEATHQYMSKFLAAFTQWIARHHAT
jgi:chromate reductase